MADNRTFDGRYADVEEAVRVVKREALDGLFWITAMSRTAMGQQDSQDRLEESRVEGKRNVDKAKLSLLFAAVSGCYDGRFDADIREHE